MTLGPAVRVHEIPIGLFGAVGTAVMMPHLPVKPTRLPVEPLECFEHTRAPAKIGTVLRVLMRIVRRFGEFLRQIFDPAALREVRRLSLSRGRHAEHGDQE